MHQVPSIMYCKSYKIENLKVKRIKFSAQTEISQIQDAGYQVAGTYHVL